MSVELYDISVQMKSAGYVFRYLRSGQKSRKESECADSWEAGCFQEAVSHTLQELSELHSCEMKGLQGIIFFVM